MLFLRRAKLCSLATFLLFGGVNDATAESALHDCAVTPSMRTSHYPGYGSIMPHNQLARPAGKALLADGRPVYLYVRVLDRDCVPVSGAKVELWHANPEGKHRFATEAALANEQAVFAGAGRATSDNEGRVHFLTLYPGAYRYTVKPENGNRYTVRRAPHLNLAVSHSRLKTFRTTLFFEGDEENSVDHYLKRLSDEKKTRVNMRLAPLSGNANAGFEARVDIILPDRDPFRKY